MEKYDIIMKSKFKKKIKDFLEVLNKKNKKSLNKNIFKKKKSNVFKKKKSNIFKKKNSNVYDDSVLKLLKKKSYSISQMLIRLKSNYKYSKNTISTKKKNYLKIRKNFFSIVKLEKPKKKKLNFFKIKRTKKTIDKSLNKDNQRKNFQKKLTKQRRNNIFLQKRNLSLKNFRTHVNGIVFFKKSFLSKKKSNFSDSNSDQFEFIPNEILKKNNFIPPINHLKDIYKIKNDFFLEKIVNLNKLQKKKIF